VRGPTSARHHNLGFGLSNSGHLSLRFHVNGLTGSPPNLSAALCNESAASGKPSPAWISSKYDPTMIYEAQDNTSCFSAFHRSLSIVIHTIDNTWLENRKSSCDIPSLQFQFSLSHSQSKPTSLDCSLFILIMMNSCLPTMTTLAMVLLVIFSSIPGWCSVRAGFVSDLLLTSGIQRNTHIAVAGFPQSSYEKRL